MRREIIRACAVVAISLCSCTNQGDVKKLEKEVGELKKTVEKLEQDKSFDELLRNIESIAYLTPGSEGYTVIQTDLGRMTVQLENIEPYANGCRITLRIGNLTSATVNGAKAKMEWGSVDQKGHPLNESAKSRDVSFSESLRAGAWSSVSVILEGVPPAALGFVRVKEVSHTGISLQRPWPIR